MGKYGNLIIKDNAQRGEAQKQQKRLFYLKVVSLEINQQPWVAECEQGSHSTDFPNNFEEQAHALGSSVSKDIKLISIIFLGWLSSFLI